MTVPPLVIYHRRLCSKLEYSTIAFRLLPDEFTLSELQTIYETILERPADKRNFRKRITALGELEPSGNKRRDGAHRPAVLYRLKNPDRVLITK